MKQASKGNGWRQRWARVQRCQYKTLKRWTPCEKCAKPACHAVKVVDRWAAWCGCGN